MTQLGHGRPTPPWQVLRCVFSWLAINLCGHEGETQRNFISECLDRVGTTDGVSSGIAANRYFDGTLTFDDPTVADEAILPYYTYLEQPTQGSNAIENRINSSFARLLTPTLAVTFDSGWIHQNFAGYYGVSPYMAFLLARAADPGSGVDR